MTLEEACRLIDPATDLDALAEVEYYNGFKGKEAAAKTLREASQIVVDFIRRVSWHDAKTPPPRPARAGRPGGIVHGQTSMIHPGASTGPKRRLGGRQAVKFGADIGPAPGNDHPARAPGC